MASSTSTATLGRRKARLLDSLGPSQSTTAKRSPRVGTARTELASDTSHFPRPV